LALPMMQVQATTTVIQIEQILKVDSKTSNDDYDDVVEDSGIDHRFESPTKRSPLKWQSGDPSREKAVGGSHTQWGLQEVSDWLVQAGYKELITLFQDNEIDGEVLEALDHDALISMGMKVAGKRIKLLKDIRILTSPATNRTSAS